METTLKKTTLKGGEWIIAEADPMSVFTHEEETEEQRMIAQACSDFLVQEVHPILDRIDSMKEPEIMPSLMDKAGELGLLGVAIPEQYGGMGLDSLTSMLLTEKLGAGHSFAVAFAAHTGIGTLPLLYFGTEAQKEKYLPKLATGEWKASYCLTEPGSGSDALGAKSTAVLNEAGTHYILNGQKIWITNAGFANLFTVFAKIDGEKFTGFLVEKGTPGLTLGDEEKKMGIKGSSTRAVFFQDVMVPVENVLGEIGRGHVIAFNILNIGRIKLAAAAMGGCKKAIAEAATYAVERQQFQTPIANFGAIQYKLAEMAIRTFVCDAATYRAAKDIMDKEHELLEQGVPFNQAMLGGAEEYAIECALLKVLGSEVLDYVVDEGVQIFGGMGYSAEMPMDRAYRDARINRIFEGTNEINRLLGIDMILKRALKGQLDIMSHIMNIQSELTAPPSFASDESTSPLAAERKAIAGFKKSLLMVAGGAVQKYMQALDGQQELIMNMADMGILVYGAESALLRTEKLIAMHGEEAAKLQIAATKVTVYDAGDKIAKAGKDCINSYAEGDTQRIMLMGLKRFTKTADINVKELRRQIAAAVIDKKDYCF